MSVQQADTQPVAPNKPNFGFQPKKKKKKKHDRIKTQQKSERNFNAGRQRKEAPMTEREGGKCFEQPHLNVINDA